MNTQKRKYITILTLFCLLISLFAGTTSFAFAQEEPYTNVLDDLFKDSSFAIYRYPVDTTNYSLEVINVAETKDKRLIVYVYQPSGQKGNLRASTINISHTIDGEVQPYNYKLTYCNSESTMFKYIVDDFYLNDSETRIVDIYSISRPFDANIDTAPSGDQTISEVPYDVSSRYQFTLIDGKYSVRCDKVETRKVTDKFVGFVRYKEGFDINPSACDSHFVAFNLNAPMDKVMNARLYYTRQGVVHHFKIGDDTFDYSNTISKYAEVDYKDKVVYKGDGFFSNTYEWDRICDINTFLSKFNTKKQLYSGALINVIARNNISTEALNQLKNKQWVLSYYESPYTDYADAFDQREEFTQVADVSILELTYEYEGQIYNVGIIDNKQSGSSDPIGGSGIDVEPTDLAKLILFIIAIILLVIILLPILPNILLFLFKLIIWIIKLPFVLIKKTYELCKQKALKREQANNINALQAIQDLERYEARNEAQQSKPKAKRKRKRTNNST